MPNSSDSTPAGGRVTLVEVAADAGVSRATASLVLRGSELVAEETRARVLASMARLGYVYHRGAASLRTRRSHTVGLIVPDVTNPFFAEMTVAIEAQLDGAGHVALLGNTAETPAKQERLLALLREHGADGVLLCPADGTPAASLTQLRRWGLPLVQFARWVPGADADYVGADNLVGAQLAVEHLVARGHQRITFVGGPPGSSARRDRLRGYKLAMVRHGLATDAPPELAGPTTRAAGHQAALALAARPERPTAVLCYNDVVAFGVTLGLQSAGVRPGQDVALVGFDDVAEAALWHPPLTTVAIAPAQIGAEAVRLLLERIADPGGAPRHTVVPARLVVRESG